MYYLLGNGAYVFVSAIINQASELGKHLFIGWVVRRPAAWAERRAGDLGGIRPAWRGHRRRRVGRSSMFNK